MGCITPARLQTRTGCQAGGHLLLASTVVISLVLGAVMANPAPFSKERGYVARLRPPMVSDGGDALFLDSAPEHPARPSAMLHHLAGESLDRRAFLIDTAIRIHAPASAPAPRRSAAPHPHGVD
jgi:hypothetical protein